jgi:hypothetical protein
MFWRVQFGSPTSRATLEHMPMMKEPVEDGADCGGVLVLNSTVRTESNLAESGTTSSAKNPSDACTSSLFFPPACWPARI